MSDGDTVVTTPGSSETTIATVLCNNDCGGRCHLKAHVRDGKILRITTDDSPDSERRPQLRGCLRGRSLATFFANPNRLTYPLKRTGKRGEGKFERITWDEAIDLLSANLRRVLNQWGPDAVYIQYSTGQEGVMNGSAWARRLMNLLGGHLSFYGSYSAGCLNYIAPFITGYRDTNSYQTLLRSKLILLNGFNPAETIFETNSNYYLGKAKDAGAKIIVIDPRLTETAATFADEWLPIRPTTDAALFAAMAHTIVAEGLHDECYLNTYCLGFDQDHMPVGVPVGESYRAYLSGASDGVIKTAEWAERITGIPAEQIRRVARLYATSKPAQLLQGLGPQRHMTGEQSVRAGITLACITGNLGKLGGGWGGGEGARRNSLPIPGVPTGVNPVNAAIPVFRWTDAVVRGPELTASDGVKNGPLRKNIKFIFNLASNTLLNQHADIHRTEKILADESLCEFIVVSDHFMTSSARYADLVLPADHSFERSDIGLPWSGEKYFILGKKVLEPPAECKNEFWWLSRVAEKFDVGDAFTEGKSYDDWLRHIVDLTRLSVPSIPPHKVLENDGVYREDPGEYTAFSKEIDDIEAHPFPTPSGKIEIFSKALYDLGDPEIPATPKYLPAPEGPSVESFSQFPLQCIGPHVRNHTHSIFEHHEWLQEADPHEMWISPEDARARRIHDGDRVKVFNERGSLFMNAHVTRRMRPGVVSIPQGGWYTPDADGSCLRGCINVLTSQRSTPLAHGSAQHTLRVEVIRAKGRSHG